MLILKMNADLPISVRNLGHSIGASVKRLETSLKSDIDLNKYPKLKSIASENIYNMQNIGRSVLELGDVETFDFARLFGRLSVLQQDYTASAQSILDIVVDTLYEADKDAFSLIAPMSINETDRSFENEIQLSSVNRLEELQTLKESTSISHIAGLLRVDWSAKSFVELNRSRFEEKAKEIESNFRDVLYQNLSMIETEEIDSEIQREVKLSDDLMINFCQESVIPDVSAMLIEEYDRLFVPNEDLAELKSNAEKVVSNCMLRGAAKKLILSFNDNLREEVAPQISNFLKSVKSSSNSKRSLDKIELFVEEYAGSVFEHCNFEVNKEDQDVIVTILPVSARFDNWEAELLGAPVSITRVYLGATEIDLKINTEDKKVTLIKSDFEISDVEALDRETGLELHNIDCRDLQESTIRDFEGWFEDTCSVLVKELSSEIESD